ncbi:MAG: YicC family protein [Burkholderiales bacterium]|nr:YicC family protein [Burkholderiales bacterium]
MIYSMTGYANKNLQLNGTTLQLEIKSVNHKFADITIKTNDSLKALETTIRNIIIQEINRGKVDFKCFVKETQNEIPQLELNQKVLEKYLSILQEVNTICGNSTHTSPIELLKLPGVINNNQELEAESIQLELIDAIKKLLFSFKETQSSEGSKIQTMIEDRLIQISEIIKDAIEIVEISINEYKDKLKTRLIEAIGDSAISDSRLQQEFAFFCQKSDINEEIDRLTAHINEVQQLLKKGGYIGKRLDFICQEMNREANTFGSKSISIAATQKAVNLKVLIEQIREQVQNIM